METYDDVGGSGMLAAMGTTILVIYLGILLVLLASLWKIFTKAGKPGWAVIIPIYSTIVFLEIVGKPWWWLFLFCIPIINIYFFIVAVHRLSLSFGQGAGTTVLLLLIGIIGYPMLAFGSATYIGPPKD